MTNNKPAIVFLFITVMLDAIGIGLIMPVMPDLIIELGGKNLSNAATWGGVLAATFAVMQFTFGPVIGNLSDRFGRRPVLLLSLSAMAIDYLIMALAPFMWILVLGRMIAGITSATHSTANAYIADISKPEEKAKNFGMLGAAFGVGFVMGPIIGGFLGEVGSRAPFYAAAALASMNAIFGYFVLRETVTDAIRRPFLWKRANPFGAFKNVSKLPGVTRLLVVYFFYQIAFFTFPSVWAYFSRENFGWDSGMVGISLGAFGICMAIVQGGLIRIVIPRFGEHKTVLGGLVIGVTAFLLYSMAYEGWQVFVLVPFSALGFVTMPALQGIMSRIAGDDQQGELQGLMTSFGAIAVIISPLLMTNTFSYFTREGTPFYFPGAPFLFSMALMMLALLVFVGRKRLNKAPAE